ncbi:E3 ubiquitin-protein ligase TRIM47-like isoform X2 [Plectropomus leopardus]|uniref:E3 ubiquitin-protein ligase TRIM47-like isoform X2 n=1 Tax=Plectropomus leopardus TaxID=160734 RepID=UPI001C4C3D32|nr:E3 ubiquitin-protein ligase TRIM47-like isoform X2 [Plectropomus leopardus]
MAEPQAPVRKNHLCCRICSHVLRNPATVPCGHNFCMQCIQSCWDQDQRKNRLCGCPECGSKFPSRPEVIRNTTLADLVRDIERCDDDSTGRRRHSGPSKRPWSCTETGPSSESSLCGRHNSLLDIYCCTDEQIVCAVCASAEHRGHTIGSVKEERRRKQEELKNIQTKSKQFLQKQEKTWKKMRKTLEQIQEEAKETQDYCESILVSVIDSLQRHYMSVRELIRGQGEATAAQLENSLQTLQEKMEETRKRDAELDHLAQSDSDVHFLQEWPSLRRLCEKDHLQHFCEVSEDPLLPFEFTKKAVEQLGRRLEEFCDKQFASICETADEEEQESGEETEEDDVQQEYEASTSQSHGFSGADNTVTEQDVEPKTRAEFLRSVRSEPMSRRAYQHDFQHTRPSRRRCSEGQFGACWVHLHRLANLGSIAGERLPPWGHVAQARVSSGAETERRAKRNPLHCSESLALLSPSPEDAPAACVSQKERPVSSDQCNPRGYSTRHRRLPVWSQDYHVSLQ